MLKKLIAALRPRFRWRSSVTGRFVTELFARRSPRTTQQEEVED